MPFATTHWSLVVEAGRRAAPEFKPALEALCGTYWPPLYAFARRRLGNEHEAQDLTQAFFAHLLEKDRLAVARAERGRFRAFLLTAFNNFLANEWHKARAVRRGGDRAKVPFDFADGRLAASIEPAHELTAERLYERQWALSVLAQVYERLETEAAAAGKQEQFALLRRFLTGERVQGAYAELAVQLRMSEGAVKVAVHRLRRKYRELLRAEIAQTLADPADIDDEIRTLFAALAG